MRVWNHVCGPLYAHSRTISSVPTFTILKAIEQRVQSELLLTPCKTEGDRILISELCKDIPIQLQNCSAIENKILGNWGLIAVEGNIASGKSTLLDNFSRTYQKPIEIANEPLDSWKNVLGTGENLFERFYHHPRIWGFAFEIFTLLTRVQAFHKNFSPAECLKLSERSLQSGYMCFAKHTRETGLMTANQMTAYKDLYSTCLSLSPLLRPHAVVYVRTDPAVCMERLRRRGRAEEMNPTGEEDVGVSAEYLQALHERMDNWLLGGEGVGLDTRQTPLFILDGTLGKLRLLEDFNTAVQKWEETSSAESITS
eukprot:Rmarinus@m.6263